MKLFPRFLLILIIFSTLPSCKLFYPNIMFRQKEYQFFDMAQKEVQQYLIEPGDQFSLALFSRDGFRLIDVLGGSLGGTTTNNSSISNLSSSGGAIYLVDYEGFAKLPIIGQFYVKGYTETELERVLEEKYSNLFVAPYVLVTVVNRRCFVFEGSSGTVVGLNEAPTNLFEVIAKSGGIASGMKSYNIKIIRGDLKNPQIHVVDLSTVEGLRKADLIIQSNDIIYIEPKRQVATDAIAQLSPLFAWASTILSTIALVYAFKTANGTN